MNFRNFSLSEKMQKIFLGIVIFCTLFVIAREIYQQETRTAEINKAVSIELDDTLGENIYSVKNLEDRSIYGTIFRNAVDNHYTELKEGKHIVDNPLFIYNLFGTNELGINVFFRTDKEYSVDYTIAVDDPAITDFTRTLKNDGANNLTKIHEYQIIGFVKGYVNTLTLELKDSDGNLAKTKKFEIDFTNVETNSQLLATVEEGESTSELEEGLYTICGNDSDTQDYMAMYDNDGILRSEIPIIGYRSHKVLFHDGNMIFSISQTKMVEMSRLGRVVDVYHTDGYYLHHDYTFDKAGDLLILASKLEKDTDEDCIIKINLETEALTEVVDFEPLFQSYVDTCFHDTEAARDEGEEDLDWLHLNSIEYIEEDDSVLLSSRETSSILKVSAISTQPKLEYMLCDEAIWKDTEFSEYVYKKLGDFKIHAGQHSLNYIKSETEGIYYLAFFDNNYGLATTQPDFDYATLGITNKNAIKGDESYYYVYKVDENNRTFELVESVTLEYSGIVSSVQLLENGNLLTDSGTAGIYVEFDEGYNIIRKFSLNLNKYMVYRVFKYDYKNVWFQ